MLFAWASATSFAQSFKKAYNPAKGTITVAGAMSENESTPGLFLTTYTAKPSHANNPR
jgi:hypothetical protein